MAQITKNKTGFQEVSVEFDTGDQFKGAERYNYLSDKYGSDVVDSWIDSKLTVVVQSKISSLQGKDPENAPTQDEIQRILDNWKPGVVTRAPSVKKQQVASDFLKAKREELGDKEFKEFLKSMLEG